jgi:hypothetical protein
MAERGRHESADGRRVCVPRGVQQRGGVVDRHSAGNPDAAVRQGFRRRVSGLELVTDLPQQLR